MIFRFVVSNENRNGVTKSYYRGRPVHGSPHQGGAGSLKKRGGVKLRYEITSTLTFSVNNVNVL